MNFYCVSKNNSINIEKTLIEGEFGPRLSLCLKTDFDLKNIPMNITEIILRSKNKNVISNVPSHIKYLKLMGKFSLDNNLFFGAELHFLELELNFSLELHKYFFPPTLKILKFGKKYNQIIKENVLPDNLEELYFGNKFNQTIEKNVLPQELKILHFGYLFNQRLYKKILPEKLTELCFGATYNFDISNELPDNLEKLYLGNNFNVEIQKNALPKNLITLKFGYSYNKDISSNIFPESLKFLYLSNNCNGIITKENLPQNLEELYYQTKQHKTSRKPNRLMANTKILSLPTNLKKVVIINPVAVINTDIFVESIEDLTLNISSITKEKLSLRLLKLLNGKFAHGLSVPLPKKLKNLDIYVNQNDTYTFEFPAEMKTITLRNIKLKDTVLPAKLEKLRIDDLNSLNCKLPDELLSLTVKNSINADALPPSLKTIAFEETPHNITTNLPLFLETIQLKFHFYDHNTKNIINMFPKLPFGCKLVDYNNNEIMY